MPVPPTRGRGRPPVYPDRLFLKAFVIMMVWRLHKVNEFLAGAGSTYAGDARSPWAAHRPPGTHAEPADWEHRLAVVLSSCPPVQIGCLWRHLGALFQLWTEYAHVTAIDSTVLRALGGVWHKKDREAGVVPHTSIDPEAHWTTSGWHGWAYGWKLHLVCTAARVWMPLAAELTPANAADNLQAPAARRRRRATPQSRPGAGASRSALPAWPVYTAGARHTPGSRAAQSAPRYRGCGLGGV